MNSFRLPTAPDCGSPQADYVPPPPVDETAAEKMERISATIKLSRNEITEIMWGSFF